MDKLALRVAARHTRQAEALDPVSAESIEAGRYTFPREWYVPQQVKDQPPTVPEGTDLAIWTYDVQGAPYAICFMGKQAKPLWHNRFRSEAHRQQTIDKQVESRRSQLKAKSDEMQRRKDYQHDHKVGDIFVTSWGYDQTNVEFYEVTEVRGKDLILREIAKDTVNSGEGSERVVGLPGKFIGAPQRARPNANGYVKVDGHLGSKWDGKPQHETPFGMGH